MLDSTIKISSSEEKINLFDRLFEKNTILKAYEYEESKTWKYSLAKYSSIHIADTPEDRLYTFHIQPRFVYKFLPVFKTSHPARCIRSLTVSEKENFIVCAHGLPPIPELSDFSQKEINLSKTYYANDKLNGLTVEIFKHHTFYFIKNKTNILLVSKDLSELNIAGGRAIGSRVKEFLDYLENATKNQHVLVFEICAPKKEWCTQINKEPGYEKSWLAWLNIDKTQERAFIPILNYPKIEFVLTGIVNFPYSFYPQTNVDELAEAFDIPRPHIWEIPQANPRNKNTPAKAKKLTAGYIVYMYNSEIMAQNTTALFKLQKRLIKTAAKNLNIL
jgi:hypothetical protein